MKKLQAVLEAEGLEPLLDKFAAEGVTDSILSELSDADLQQLGIEKLGERKRLLLRFAQSETQEESVAGDKAEGKPSSPQEDFAYDAENGQIVITGFRGKGHVVVPDKFDDLPLPVRIIGKDAFAGNGMILSVVLPEGLTEIRGGAFNECSSMASIVLPQSLKKISGFQNCASLTSIALPSSIEEIGSLDDYTFAGCNSLTSVIIPSSVKRMAANAFRRCSGLTSLTICDGAELIDGFGECTGLTTVIIPSSTKVIGYKAFYNCASLTSLDIRDGVRSIKGAFMGCTGLTSISLPESLEEIGGQTEYPEVGPTRYYGSFANCTALTTITIPSSVKQVDRAAFYQCSGLTNLTIRDGAGAEYMSGFNCCDSLVVVNIPSSVRGLTDSFNKCAKLESVTVNYGVEYINESFNDCRSLRSILIPESVILFDRHAPPGKETLTGCPCLVSVKIPEALKERFLRSRPHLSGVVSCSDKKTKSVFGRFFGS